MNRMNPSDLPCDVETDDVPDCAPAVYSANVPKDLLYDSGLPDSGVGLSYTSFHESHSLKATADRLSNLHITDSSRKAARSQNILCSKGREASVELSKDEGFESLKSIVVEKELLIGSGPSAEPEESVDPAFDQDDDGDTQLHIATIHWSDRLQEIVRRARRVDHINIQNDLRQTALHLSVLTNQPAAVRILMAAGASVTARDHKGNTPLHIASGLGFQECVIKLTQPITTEDINSLRLPYKVPHQKIPQTADLRNYDGHTCLHLAAAGNHIEVINYLVNSRFEADINAKDGKSGRTVLHHVVERRNLALLQWLIQRTKVDLEARTYDQNTPLSLAKGRGFQEICRTLAEAGVADSDLDWDDSDESDDDMVDDCDLDDIQINGLHIISNS